MSTVSALGAGPSTGVPLHVHRSLNDKLQRVETDLVSVAAEKRALEDECDKAKRECRTLRGDLEDKDVQLEKLTKRLQAAESSLVQTELPEELRNATNEEVAALHSALIEALEELQTRNSEIKSLEGTVEVRLLLALQRISSQ